MLTGRIRYIDPDREEAVTPFGNTVAIYGGNRRHVDAMLRNFDCVYVPKDARVGVDRSGLPLE
jgi:hypothetical protein